MKRFAKAICFCIATLFFLGTAAILRAICFVFSLPLNPIMASTTQLWAKVMTAIVGISTTVEGEENFTGQNAALVASNHLGYIDIIAVASALPALFVAKREVRRWPLLGWMARLGGTIFVDRTLIRGGIAAANEIVNVLKSNVSVHIFPEGTSSSGETVLPFKPSLFTAALEANVPVLPMTIQYTSIDAKPFSERNRDLVCWYGKMEFAGHFLQLLNCRAIEAVITIHQPIIPSIHSTPHLLAFHTHTLVSSGFRPKSGITLLQEGVL